MIEMPLNKIKSPATQLRVAGLLPVLTVFSTETAKGLFNDCLQIVYMIFCIESILRRNYSDFFSVSLIIVLCH